MRNAKVDRNQRAIIKALRKAGATVQPLHTVGQGCPDLLVGARGKNLLLEVKDGKKIPSARRLTDDEVKWHLGWEGTVLVVESVEEALEAVFGVGGETTLGSPGTPSGSGVAEA